MSQVDRTPVRGPTEHSSTNRWWWFSNERAPVGTTGPFGPIEARTVAEAKRIAAVRAGLAGLTLHSVEATYHREGLDAR